MQRFKRTNRVIPKDKISALLRSSADESGKCIALMSISGAINWCSSILSSSLGLQDRIGLYFIRAAFTETDHLTYKPKGAVPRLAVYHLMSNHDNASWLSKLASNIDG